VSTYQERDSRHLDLLATGHYVAGVLIALFSCMFIFHIVIGLSTLSGGGFFFPKPTTGHGPPPAFGWMFVVMGTLFFLIGQVCAILTIISGRYIKKRKNHTYSFVVACISCALPPFFTVLGVFAIIVLSRDSVRLLYGKKLSMDYSDLNKRGAEQSLAQDT
jgi:hypothetical protein